MATESFDSNWIDGAPVVTRDAVTRAFDFWYQDFPLINEGLIDPTSSTGAFTFAAMTIAGSGSVLNPVTGTGTFTFGAMTIAGTGSVVNPVTGTGAFTFDAMTVAGAGTVTNPVTGTGAFTFADMTVAGAGTYTVIGNGAFTFDDMTVAGTGTYSVLGAGAFTFDAMTVAGAGTVLNPVTGVGAFTFDAMTVSGAGSVGVGGTGAFTFDNMSVAGVGTYTPATNGTANITFDNMSVAGDGQPIIDQTGFANFTFAPMTVAGAGSVLLPVTGQGDLRFTGLAMGLAAGEVSNPGDTQDYPDMPAPLIGHRRRFLSRNTTTKMESERLRVRRMFPDSLPLFEVQWGFTQDQFDTFKTWFETILRNGTDPFFLATFETLDDTHFIREVDWILAFMGPYSWSGSDNSFVVSATLEVIEKVVLPDSIVNPTNPPKEEDVLPELEHNFEGFECQEMFNLKATLQPFTAYAVEISDEFSGGKNGTYRPHVYFKVQGNTEWHATFNNDYGGETWFRIVATTTNRLVRKPTKPDKSFVAAPHINVSRTQGAMHGLWGDFAYNNKSPTNQRINPFSYYIVPRQRVMYWSGSTSLDPDPAPRVVDSASSTPDTITRWSRFNLEPTIDTVYPDWDDTPNNARVSAFDFGYAIRARAFISGGCKSPFSLCLVDKAIWQRPLCIAHGSFADLSDTCDMKYSALTRLDWTRNEAGGFVFPPQPHEFESGDSCEQFVPKGIRKTLIENTRGGPAAADREFVFIRGTSEDIFFNRVFLGTGDGGDYYIGWDTQWVATGTFFADSIELDRVATWNLYPPCYTNSSLALGNDNDTRLGQYIVNPRDNENDLIVGPNGSSAGIESTWNHDTVGGIEQGGAPIKWINDFVHPLVDPGEADGHSRFNVHVVLTLHNDALAPKVLDDPSVIPPPPPPEPVPPVMIGETWETYPEIATAELVINLDHGTGWHSFASWRITNVQLDFGNEPFNGYIDGVIPAYPLDSGMNKGDGWWPESWTIKDSLQILGLDTFEEYAFMSRVDTGPLASVPLAQAGTNWTGYWLIKEPALVYGRDDFNVYITGEYHNSFMQEGGTNWRLWWIMSESATTPGYKDSFESYIEFDYSTSGTWGILTDGTGWAPGHWILPSAQPYGYDNFESYSTGAFASGSASGPNWGSTWTIKDI